MDRPPAFKLPETRWVLGPPHILQQLWSHVQPSLCSAAKLRLSAAVGLCHGTDEGSVQVG